LPKKGFDLKNITGDEDLNTPLILLFMYSMMFIAECMGLMKNLDAYGSVILIEPILFADNIFETIGNLCWFSMSAAILYAALVQKQLFLKFTYLLGTLPFILTGPIINKLGYKSLHVIKVAVIFTVTMCLFKYLITTIKLYQDTIKKEGKADNHCVE
jgi:hypothetical protein